MRLVGLICAAAVLRDDEALREGFAGLSDDLRGTLNRAVSETLFRSGDMQTWGWAVNRMPGSGDRIAAEEFGKRLDAFRPPPPRVVDTRRKEMSRLAFRLLRGGAGSKILIAHMRSANAQLPDPLPGEELDNLIVWCVKQHMEAANAR